MIINRMMFHHLPLMVALLFANAAHADPDRVDADAALPAAQTSVAVKLAKIQQKSIGENVFSYGVLAPDPNHLLGLALSKPGLISRVWVRAGQAVRRGERLVEVVTAPEAHRQFQQAQTAVDFADKDMKRKLKMRAGKLVTRAEVDLAIKRLKDAKSRRAALRQLGFDRRKEILYAAADGIITRLDIVPGQRVPANSIAMWIATKTRLVARLGITQEDLHRIKISFPVTVTSVFNPGIKVTSRIREIHSIIDPATHLVEILVPIPDQQGLILGSRVIGRVHLPQHIALMVPRSAVLSGKNSQDNLEDDSEENPRRNPEKNSERKSGPYLFRAQHGTAKYIAIKTGIETGGLIEVTGDIKKGDSIIISGNYELRDGMKIREER